MADLDNATKAKLESILQMSGGYVLDFSNASFAEFVRTAIGFDPYEKFTPASKAALLRTIWRDQPDSIVAKLNLELLEHWRIGRLPSGAEPTAAESPLHDELKRQYTALVMTINAADTKFLSKDFGAIDLSALPRELTSQTVVEARLREIDDCLAAQAPLAVIFLVGSTLEGLLMELALANASAFTASGAAPKKDGKTRPIPKWSLAELIEVSHAVGVLGPDVFRFSDHVRSFRNYIHPRQQLTDGFEPRMETARIAHQVLRGALTDLETVLPGTPWVMGWRGRAGVRRGGSRSRS